MNNTTNTTNTTVKNTTNTTTTTTNKPKSIRTVKLFDSQFSEIYNKKNMNSIAKVTYNSNKTNRSVWSNFIINKHGVEIIYYYKKSNSVSFTNEHMKKHIFKYTIVDDHEFYFHHILSYHKYEVKKSTFNDNYPLCKYFIDENNFRYDITSIKHLFNNNKCKNGLLTYHTIRCSIYLQVYKFIDEQKQQYNYINEYREVLKLFLKYYFYDSIYFKLNRKPLCEKEEFIWCYKDTSYYKMIKDNRKKKDLYITYIYDDGRKLNSDNDDNRKLNSGNNNNNNNNDKNTTTTTKTTSNTTTKETTKNTTTTLNNKNTTTTNKIKSFYQIYINDKHGDQDDNDIQEDKHNNHEYKNTVIENLINKDNNDIDYYNSLTDNEDENDELDNDYMDNEDKMFYKKYIIQLDKYCC